MRVTLVTPAVPPALVGNAVTAARWQARLAEVGIRLTVVDALAPDAAARLSSLLPQTDLLHLHHAHKSGQLALSLPVAGQVPWVVSFAGTDVWTDDTDPVLLDVVDRARLVLSPDGRVEAALTLEQRLKLRLLPKGVDLPPPAPLPDLGVPEDRFLFLLPAGIRMVKRPMLAIDGLELLADRYAFHLLLVGPILDAALGEVLHARLQHKPWASYGGTVERPAMAALLQRAQVVLNCSYTEGFANAVAEAMSVGRPVLAARNAGNEAALADTGCYFDDLAGLTAAAERLLTDGEYRRTLGERAQQRAMACFSPEGERDTLAACYREALSAQTAKPPY